MPGLCAGGHDDVVMVMNKRVINDALRAIGPLRGTGTFSYRVLGTGSFHWTLNDTRVELEESKGIFLCEARVIVETTLPFVGHRKFEYVTPVTGLLNVSYDSNADIVEFSIKKALLELYVQIGEARIVIKRVDVASWINKEPIQIHGLREQTVTKTRAGCLRKPNEVDIAFNDKHYVLEFDVPFCSVKIVRDAVALSCSITSRRT